MGLELVRIDLSEANAFVAEHHRHHVPVAAGGGFRSLTEHIDTATPAGSHKRGPPKGGPFFHFQQ